MGFNQYVPSISSQTENDKVTAPCLHSPCWLTQGQSVDKLKESSWSNGIHPKLPTLHQWLQHLLPSLSSQVAGNGSEGAVTTRATLNVGYILMGAECMFFLRICQFNHACCCHWTCIHAEDLFMSVVISSISFFPLITETNEEITLLFDNIQMWRIYRFVISTKEMSTQARNHCEETVPVPLTSINRIGCERNVSTSVRFCCICTWCLYLLLQTSTNSSEN